MGTNDPSVDEHAHLFKSEEEWGAILSAVAEATSLPNDLPFITDRDTWKRISDECMCGSCHVCVFFRSLRTLSDGPIKPTEERDHSKPRWPSITAALDDFLSNRRDGYPVPSIMGAMLSCKGDIVRARRGFDPSFVWAAHDLAHVARALEECPGLAGLSWGATLAVVMARIVGREDGSAGYRKLTPIPEAEVAARYGVACTEVRAIVRLWRERLSVELMARGLVRVPSNTSVRRMIAIEYRRGEITR